MEEPLASSHITGSVNCRITNNKEDGEVVLANRGEKEQKDRAERPML